MILPWIWDERKNEANRKKHKLSFEVAQLVFNDPLALSRPDPHPEEERWQTVGKIGLATIIVVHTTLEIDLRTGEEIGRIISARKATSHERKIYEGGEF